jgi:uncharacterized damage-inducible protein DinB
MAIKDALLAEFDHEMGTTRRLLERVPPADFAWKPHDKSFSLGQLAGHISTIPHWASAVFGMTEFDISAFGEETRPKEPPSVTSLLETFDKNVRDARKTVDEQIDSAMTVPWTFKKGGQVMFSMPRASVWRTLVMNHIIHHRGQLSVYLRLRNVPLPSLYGPTADEG